MRIINELIVVEGKHDTANLKRHFIVDVKETGGSNVSRKFITELKQQAKNRKIIILTDPDTNGNNIRETISREILDCQHAYLSSDKCRKKTKVGVEFASKETLEEALNNLVSFKEVKGSLTVEDLYTLKLCGNKGSKDKRKIISDKYYLGKCNSKTLLKRLNALNITRNELIENLKNEKL